MKKENLANILRFATSTDEEYDNNNQFMVRTFFKKKKLKFMI